MQRIVIVPRRTSPVKQDLFPSVSAAFEHFRQTGESVFESTPSNSYDFGDGVDIKHANLEDVPRDTTLVEAFLLNHGEKSRQELNKDGNMKSSGEINTTSEVVDNQSVTDNSQSS